jgi:hypothetical protein
LRCHTCATPCSETRETVFFDLRTTEDNVMMALKRLLVRVDLAGSSVVRGVTAATVLAWRRRAAHQAAAIHRHLLRTLPVTQGQLDERGHCGARKHAREPDEAGARRPHGEEGRQGLGVRCAPALRLLSAAVVGPRPLDMAQEVVAVTQARVAGIPACCSDGFTCALAARLAAFHVVTTGARPGKRGRPRQPRCAPHPDLGYGQVVQPQPQGKLLTRSTRVVLGAERRTHWGVTISTAWVERVTLTWRQALAPWARQTSSGCTDRERMRQHVVVFQAFDTVARPPMRVRQPLPRHERTRRGALGPRWQARTPAMAAGLPDPVGTFRALLTATFAPLDSQSISE